MPLTIVIFVWSVCHGENEGGSGYLSAQIMFSSFHTCASIVTPSDRRWCVRRLILRAKIGRKTVVVSAEPHIYYWG